MRRRRLRAALLVVVAASLAVIGYHTVRSMLLRQAKSTAKQIGETIKAEVAQQIRNFKRVKVEHGKAVWEVEADEAQYLHTNDEVIVRGPRVTVHVGDGRVARLTGTEGRLRLTDGELAKVKIKGTVTVQLDDLTLTTEMATYDRVEDVVRAPGPVVLTSRTMEVRGIGMEVALTPQTVRLLQQVETVLRSDDDARS